MRNFEKEDAPGRDKRELCQRAVVLKSITVTVEVFVVSSNSAG